jgi:hypothetical protein
MQTPLNLNSKNPAGALVTTNVGAAGDLRVTRGGTSSKLNLAAGNNVVKAAAGRVARVSFTTAATGVCGVYDTATVGGIGAATLIWQAATTTEGQIVDLDWPCANGIVVVVGTAGVASVSFA